MFIWLLFCGYFGISFWHPYKSSWMTYIYIYSSFPRFPTPTFCAQSPDSPCCHSVPKSCSTLCNPMNCSTPGFPVLYCLLEFAQTHVYWVHDAKPSNHLIFHHPLLLLPSIFPSIRVFSNELALSIRWPKYWSFGISPSNEYSGLISFRIDWFNLLAVQGTLKSLLLHHSSKASILWHSAFFMVQLSHLYMTTGKP